MNERFDELIQKFKKQKASPEELDELWLIINENTRNEHAVKDNIEEILSDRQNVPVWDRSKETYHDIMKTIEAKEKKKQVPFNRPVWRWMAAALIVGILGTAAIFLPRVFSSGEMVTKIDTINSFSEKTLIDLPDGSTVILNDSSTLTYNDTYGKTLREVTLVGEASFDIKRDSLHPFVVNTGDVRTEVLGTAFNINAYPRKNKIVVTVTHGKVQVLDKSREVGVITPDQQIAVNTLTHDIVKKDVNAATELQWQRNFLILDNVPFNQAIAMISDRYHVTIAIANPDLRHCSIKSSFLNNETLEEVLTTVSSLLNTTYTIQNKSVVINGPGCH